MAHYEINGEKVYIDNLLKKQLDKKIIPSLKNKDMDAVYIVDGRERTGKSVFAMSIGGYVSTQFKMKFDISNICLNPTEFRMRIINSKKNEVIVYDEAHTGMGSSSALSEINKLMKDLMMEMGQKNLFVIIVLPTFFLLERYAALFRTNGVFHVYTNKSRRGFWCYYNDRNKKRLYMKGKRDFNYNCMPYPRFRGRFFNQYAIDEEKYREKKRKSFSEKKRSTREEKAQENVKRMALLLKGEYGLPILRIEELYNKYKIGRKKTMIAQDLLTTP